MRDWTDLTPQQAHAEFGASETGALNSDVRLPLNELGEPCPWPWEPEQLVGAPLGQYHCPYCGAMVVAGAKHFDYTDEMIE